jgi:hypothetical protein
MKHQKICSLAIVALLSISALHAQTVDEIIDKHIDALGGKDKLSQINSIYMESNIQMNGSDNPNVITILNGKGYKSETEFNGSKIIQCVSDKAGWMINPMAGATDPTPLPDDQYKLQKMQIDVGGGLFNYKDKGNKAELLGQEKAGDVNAYKIKVTTPDSAAITYWIDQSTYYIIQAVVTANVQGQSIDITSTYSNFQKTDFGFVVPYSIEVNYGGQFNMPITVKKVEINKQVDPSIFEMPKQ